jgi:hypothetical protein
LNFAISAQILEFKDGKSASRGVAGAPEMFFEIITLNFDFYKLHPKVEHEEALHGDYPRCNLLTLRGLVLQGEKSIAEDTEALRVGLRRKALRLLLVLSTLSSIALLTPRKYFDSLVLNR